MADIASVLHQMEGSGIRLRLVILDACRNNPFEHRGPHFNLSGLAQMATPEGTLISYPGQPGHVARDDSSYTKALVRAVQRPGLAIFDVFNEVGLTVEHSTGAPQLPWVSFCQPYYRPRHHTSTRFSRSWSKQPAGHSHESQRAGARNSARGPAIEKGPSGDHAFEAAFSSWEQMR